MRGRKGRGEGKEGKAFLLFLPSEKPFGKSQTEISNGVTHFSVEKLKLFYRIVALYATLFYDTSRGKFETCDFDVEVVHLFICSFAHLQICNFLHFLIDTDFANAYNGLELIAAYTNLHSILQFCHPNSEF